MTSKRKRVLDDVPESICKRKRVSDFSKLCSRHWTIQAQRVPTLFLEGVIYIDAAERKKRWKSSVHEPERIGVIDWSSEEIEAGMQLQGLPFKLRHMQPIGRIIHDAYDTVPDLPGAPMSGVFIYAAVPMFEKYLASRQLLAFTLLSRGEQSLQETCALSLLSKPEYYEGGGTHGRDLIQKVLCEVSAAPEGKGHRADCNVTNALFITNDGETITHI